MLSATKTIKSFATGFLVTTTLASSAFANTIQGIQVTGNKRIESETVISNLPLKVGDSFDDIQLNQALKDLFATGYFADVKIHRQNNGLLVEVTENSLINRISFEGNSKLKEDKLTEEIQLRPREVLSRTKIQAAQQRILEIYRRMGRFDATVEPKVIRLEENRVDLVFEINEGEVTYVRKINFIGNKHFSSSRLEEQLFTKRARWFRLWASDDTFDPDRFTADQQNLQQYYFDMGYPDYRLVSAVAELSPDHKDFYLTFTVDEGELYTFGKIDVISHLKQVNAEELKTLVDIQSGAKFSRKQIERNVTSLNTHVGTYGYAFADIQPRIEKNREKKTIDLIFEVREGPRVYIERIDVVGNDRTRDEVIRRELGMLEGDAYNSTKLKKAEKNLKDLGYFKKSEIQTEQGTAPDKARLVVKLEEQPTGEMGVAAGFSTLDGILGNVKFAERNFMGTGRIVHANVTLARRAQEYDVGITDPYFLGYNLEAGIDLFRLRSTRLSHFISSTNGFSPHIAYSITEYLGQTLTYTLKNDHISHIANDASAIIKQQAGKFVTSAVGQTLAYDRRDSRIDPTSGYLLSLSNQYAGLGGKVNFLKNSIGATWFYSPIEDVVINVRGNVSAILRAGKKPIRIVDSIQLGADSFRGFAWGGIGPRDSITRDPMGGTRSWTGTIETLFPIGLPNEFGVKGAIFTDFGTTWKAGQTGPQVIDRRTIRASVGIGLSWTSPFGPLKIDYAIPVKREKYDDTQRFLFGFSSRW
ncbi:MAG: outer membrane protein assembly factor BamA [Alphaproteobacteria bacterium]|nr:outer membrane protein assembly factor BamA [Alphaproteobacteria bacterium]